MRDSIAKQKISVLVVLLAWFVAPAFGQGTTGLLGVFPGFPQLDATGVSGQQGCSYDAVTRTLTITSTPNLYFSDANTIDFVNGGVLTISANLGAFGSVLFGSLTVNGTTTSGMLGNPLLLGTVTGMGLENSNAGVGTTDRADFRIKPATTPGSIVADDPNWPDMYDIAANVTLEGSSYDGSLDDNWDCNRAVLTVGAIPSDEIEVMIEVKPDPATTNCVNINGVGQIPVAIFGEQFFEVDKIDPTTLVFSGLDVAVSNGQPQCSIEKVDGDVYDDLLCQFVDNEANWRPDSSTQATLIGALITGTPITGIVDDLCVVGGGGGRGSSGIGTLTPIVLALIGWRRRRVKRAARGNTIRNDSMP